MSTLNFANCDSSATYSIICRNESQNPWTFYLYQTLPENYNQVFSLAWFVTPYKVPPGAQITFSWTVDYSFVLGESGVLQPGMNYHVLQSVPADPNGKNQTTLHMVNNLPLLSNPINNGQEGTLSIKVDTTIPMNKYSTGIGMSGQGILVQQALPNTIETYAIYQTQYHIAAGLQESMGDILPSYVSNSSSFQFRDGTFTLTATFGENNEWTISE